MTGFGFMSATAFSCSTAAAGFSAFHSPVVDTAGILAVSICVLPWIRVRKKIT